MSMEVDQARPPSLLTGLALTAALAASCALLPLLPRAGEPVAIFAPLGTQAALMGAIAEAGGAIAGSSGTKIALAMPGGPDFVSRLRTLGYWLVLDGRAVTLCGPSPTPPGGPLVRQSF